VINKYYIPTAVSRNIVLSLIVLIVTGCKVNVETELNLSDILRSKSKIITGNLYVEVAGCSSHEDSRNASRSVIKVGQTIPRVFKGAEYIECFTKKFDSFAHFSVPIAIDKDIDGKLSSEDYINIVSNEKRLLGVAIPEVIRQNLERVKSESFGASSFDLSVKIRINNDIGKPFPFKVISAYIDNKPYVWGELKSKEKGSFVVSLSDVSVDEALQNGVTDVLIY